MSRNIIGRQYEQQVFNDLIESKQSEFVIIYGRRRIGKTYLVKEFFNNSFTFFHTGIANSNNDVQLKEFNNSLRKFGKMPLAPISDWFDAFYRLEFLVENLSDKEKKVIFIDEMPWLDNAKSGFIQAFEYFWNSWASARRDILLIACGSATSWMFDKIVNSHGGLHNRVTRQINLKPFTLKECEEYFLSKKIKYSRKQITEAYMIFGGVPFYLNFFQKKYSVAQNVDEIIFSEQAPLKNEFFLLYNSLFKKSENHIAIVNALSTKKSGLSRGEISNLSKISNGGGLTKILNELELSGFIRRYQSFSKKQKDVLYQLTDNFSLFYFNFVKELKYNDEKFWTNHIDDSKYKAWTGYAFEQIVLSHLNMVKLKLGIVGILTNTASWICKGKNSKAQIDLLIDRKDGAVNICEIKFSKTDFTIDKKTMDNMYNKINTFIEETKTKKTIFTTLITPFGLKQNKYSGEINSEITLDDLFG
ncbi:MAG: ATP-binding protein [Bacteroidales bacterium]|jgi:AAA+ ATPase superfamily predicted ATPase|nr:ATP-binding protein [Bacteroidales bacterium]